MEGHREGLGSSCLASLWEPGGPPLPGLSCTRCSELLLSLSRRIPETLQGGDKGKSQHLDSQRMSKDELPGPLGFSPAASLSLRTGKAGAISSLP